MLVMHERDIDPALGQYPGLFFLTGVHSDRLEGKTERLW